MKQKLHKFILIIFLFTLSFTAAFAIGPLLQIYIITSILLVVFTAPDWIATKISMLRYSFVDYLLGVFLFYLAIVTLFFANEKSLIYLFVYIFIYFFIYQSITFSIKKLGLKIFLKYNSVAVFIIAIFVIFEFVFYNIGLFDI